MDLKLLEHFAAVAEELSFTRAAAKLHLSQSALSRSVRALEDSLGCSLFVRNTRQVTLTPAGQALRAELPALVDHVTASLDRVRSTGRSSTGRSSTGRSSTGSRRQLVVGASPNYYCPAARHLLQLFSDHFPDIELTLRAIPWWGESSSLRKGAVDATFALFPNILSDAADLSYVPLQAQPRVFCLPTTHKEAHRRYLSLNDVVAEPLVYSAYAPPSVAAFWTVSPRPDGSEPKVIARCETPTDFLREVADGRGIGILPASSAALFPHPGVVYAQAVDLPPAGVCIAMLQTRARRPELVDLRVTAEKVAATTSCRVWPDSSVHRLR
ncbi:MULTISPECIES: LysR family transcriptional regulator [unclassified Frankia]|uniref:LysR family transcriptional regulator n=1 Tax=unclassified Frankia TaxID=2632575 RepID=UPI002AD3B918|nr:MULTISPECIES: LysR family transcriptional regulator [unclassified Frankia]